jgi:adenine-specific DNA-methyltransferase
LDKIDLYNALDAKKIKNNYFSDNFGGKYFSDDIAKIIGFVREDIEKNKAALTENEYFTLITSLMYSMDRIANTVGHYDAYIKKDLRAAQFEILLLEKLAGKSVRIFSEDSNALAKKISVDIAYIDPPYNSRQYERFYHLWENIAEWSKPELFGAALKPNPKRISKYCQSTAKQAFADLIENINAKYIAVSYNNTYNSKSQSSRNKMTIDDILEILHNKGETKTFEHSHKCFSAGKTDFDNHKEFLFIVKAKK